MFKFNYKLRVVNAQKGVVSLQPTLGTYVKAFAPTVVIFGGLALIGAVLEANERKLNEQNQENPTV